MLIVDGKWLLIGPNRHGSIYAARVLEAAFETRRIGYDEKWHHTPLCNIPKRTKQKLRVVGIIRCPLRWYVSKWGASSQEAAAGERIPFQKHFDRHWLDPHGPMGQSMERFPKRSGDLGVWSYKHIAYHCEDAKNILANMSRDEIADAYLGLLSTDEMMCTETLTRDLVRIFGDVVRPYLRQARNVSHVDTQGCSYTDERLALIREKDGWLVRHYPKLQSHGVLA